MKRKLFYALVIISLLLALPLIGKAQSPSFNPQQASSPVITGWGWSDAFDDDSGLVRVANAVAINGALELPQFIHLGYANPPNHILSMIQWSNGYIYLGVGGAYLNLYNPNTGAITSLGTPVPTECNH